MKILNIAMGANFTEDYSYQDNLLSEYQHKLGHSVTVLTGLTSWNECGQKIQTAPCDKIMVNGVRLIRIKSGNKITNTAGYYPQISKILASIKPDLIFIHGLCNFIPIQIIKYKKDNPHTILVADNHQDKDNFNCRIFPFSMMVKLWRMGWKRWSKHFNYIYGTTGWRKDFAVEVYGIPQEKTDVLPLGVDTDNISADPEKLRQEVRSELGIANEDFVFIHGGKMNSPKRTLDLMRAFSGVQDKSARLILFGSVSNDIQQQFEAFLQSDPRMIYVGYQKSKLVHRLFYASDFCLFPGLHSVLWEEAIGCGLPGIFLRFTDHDHTNTCNNSILVEPSASVSDLQKIMDSLLEDADFYCTLKQNALVASKEFSYYEIAAKSINSNTSTLPNHSNQSLSI